MMKPFHWFKTKIMMIKISGDTSIIQETTFTNPNLTETTSTLQLRQKVKRNKLTVLCRHLNVTGDPDLADVDRFMLKKNSKTYFIKIYLFILQTNVLVSF